MADPEQPRSPTNEFQRLGGSFADTAEAYELGRPGYPTRAIDWWTARRAFDDGHRVLDLAAGTGKLTRMVPSTCEVSAVEPIENMRREFRRSTAKIEIVDGSAEAIPFPDDSFDTVLVAQAFHWFNAPVALDEIARVLRSGGGLGLIWNQDDVDGADWLDEVVEQKRSISASPIAAGMRAANELSTHPWFDPADSTEIRWVETSTVERVIANVESRSYVAVLDDQAREAVLGRVRDALGLRSGERSLTDEIGYPHRTFVYWSRCPV